MMRQFFYHNDRYFSEVYSPVYGKGNTAETKKSPVIIHFIDRQKPWSHRTILMADKWWKYVKMQDERTLREHITPFAAFHRAPLSAGPDVTAAASAVPNVGGGNAVYHGPVTSSHLRASAQVVSS